MKRNSIKSICTFIFTMLFASCSFEGDITPSFNESTKDYMEYWSSTCKVAKIQYLSANTYINGIPNLSAGDEIVINLVLINPKNQKLLCNPSADKSCFKLVSQSGNLSYSDYSETVIDPSLIRIKAKLTDNSEGERITLQGCLWPENRSKFTEELLAKENPELIVNESFIQNTPPDNIKNMYIPSTYFGDTEKHYVTFDVPDQSLKRNMGSSYAVKYYLRDKGQLFYQGKKVLTLEDNKNSDENTFNYYFDDQDDYLNYEYTVQVIGPRGLSSELFSTEPGLGVNQLCEPVIEFINEPNGLYDEDGYECFEIKNNTDEVTFTADTAFEGEELSVTIDNQTVIGENFKVKDIGQHVITLTSTKNGSRPVTVTRKIRIVKTPEPASFCFKYNSNPAVFNTGTEASGYEYVEVEKSSSKVNYEIATREEDTQVAGTVDSTDFENATAGTLSVGAHKLTAVIHKNYCNDVTVTRNIMVAKQLESPSYSFTVPLSGNKMNDFECIEVSDSNTKAGYTVKPAEADSGAKIFGTVSGTSFAHTTSKTGDAGIGEYTFTVTVTKDYMQNRTFTRKIKVIEQLQEPEILFYAGNTRIYDTKDAEDTSYSSNNGYCCYNINLTQGGTGNISYETSKGNLSLEIKENNIQIAEEGTLELGPHIFTLTVTKENYLPRTYTKKIYIQGILREPEFISSNGIKDGGSGNSSSDQQKWKFSYLKYENLHCSINAGNTGNSILLKVNNSEVPSNFSLETEKSYTLNINQMKKYCKTLSTTKFIKVNIKPVTVTDGECALNNDFGDNGNENEICGKVYIGKNGTYQKLREFSETDFKQHCWDSFNHDSFSFVLYTPSDYICYKSEGMYEDDPTGDDDIDEVETTINLSALAILKRSNQDTKLEVWNSDSDEHMGHRIKFNLSD